MAALKGELPKVTFESIKKNVKQVDMDNLFVAVEKNDVLQPYEKIAASDGLLRMFDGELPQKSQIKLLEEVFGSEFIDDLMTNQEFTAKVFQGMAEVVNIPRALMASADLSAPLRQAVFLAPSHPVRFAQAFARMFKYFFSDSAYIGGQKYIKSHVNYEIAHENNLAITEMGNDLAQREEPFMSNMASNLPIIGKIVEASSRAYSGFLNRFRFDVFNDLYNKAVAEGIVQNSDKAVRDMTNAIVGANKKDKHLCNVNPGRDFKVKEWIDARIITEDDPCPKCGQDIELKYAIEIGHTFKLGTK